MRFELLRLITCIALLSCFACHDRKLTVARQGLEPIDSLAAGFAQHDVERAACQARIAGLEPDLGGAPKFESNRISILGRATGEPMVFVQAPGSEPVDEDLEKLRKFADTTSPPSYVTRWHSRLRHEPSKLRKLVLRQGYLYSDDPIEAHWLVRKFTIGDLFNEPTVWLARGVHVHKLERDKKGYHHAGGPLDGYAAKLLFGDRFSATEQGLAAPIHRDFKDARARIGFDRAKLLHRTSDHVVAQLRFGDTWVLTLLHSSGARLEVDCLDATVETRRQVDEYRNRDSWRRRAVDKLAAAIDSSVGEQLPFDRPRGVKDHLSDGQLRPQWYWAYKRGSQAFKHDEQVYLVYDRNGRPAPPQMCVEFIIDSYERASGTWYHAKGDGPQRVVGGIDFNEIGITNRAGVLAFEKFAQGKTELFETSRFETRIPFRDRAGFFDYLLKEADRFEPGDVVAIQGPKPDGYIHQHAILIADVDPLTGFPHSLADQMRVPRRRTWEGIMAEAPLRSLLYQVHPRQALLERM